MPLGKNYNAGKITVSVFQDKQFGKLHLRTINTFFF